MKLKTELWLPLLVLAGCGAPPAKPKIYVDLSLAQRSIPAWAFENVATPRAGQVIVAGGGLPSLPAKTIELKQDPGLRATAVGAIKEARDQSKARLEEKLVRAYSTELNQTLPDLERDLRLRQSAEFLDWNETSRNRFATYAETHGRLWVRYQLLKNSPDRSSRIYNGAGYNRLRDAEAAELKKDLDSLEETYSSAVTSELATLAAAHTERVRELAKQVEAKRRELLVRAQTEATAQMRLELSRFDDVVGPMPPLRIPAVREASSRETVSVAPAKEITTRQPAELPRRIQNRAELWAKLQGYELTTNPNDSDKTDEFVQWNRIKLGL